MALPIQQSAVITQKNQLTPHVYQFVFQVQNPMTFAPGQYLTVIIDAHTRRQYSFFSPSVNPLHFDIVVDVSPMGSGSHYFLSRQVGDAVEILAPLGMFQLAMTPHRKVFVATGTGIAPFYSMIVTYLEQGGAADMALYWGLRHEEDIFFRQQLEVLQKQYANFHYIVILSKPTDAWTGVTGHVTEHVEADEKTVPVTDFYLCGNRHMVGDVKTELLAQKAKGEQIKTEPF